jgi:hypothetical protein
MEWTCSFCTYNNQFLHLACDMCKNPKASQDDEVPDEVKHGEVHLSPGVLKQKQNDEVVPNQAALSPTVRLGKY